MRHKGPLMTIPTLRATLQQECNGECNCAQET